MEKRIIKAKKLTPNTFAPFGQVILGSSGKVNYWGDGWKSLFPAGKAHLPKGEIGWVITKSLAGGLIVTGMEREPEIEIIWTVKEPIIQAVAPSGNLQNHTEQPKIDQVQAFIIFPGQVIIMHPGTWHYAAFPATNKETLYYFITRDHPREPGWENVPWIPFQEGGSVKIELNLT